MNDDPTPFDLEESYEDFLRKESEPPTGQEIQEEDELMLRRQREFKAAAEYVTQAFSQFPEVQKIVLFGSIAAPLKKEIPRFSKFRRNRVAIWHECNDVDLAVYLTGFSHLNALRKTRSRALNQVFADRQIGVPPFQVDTHLFDSRTGAYRGRLCEYGECPKPGKRDCLVKDCGAEPFLRQFENYRFSRSRFRAARQEILFLRPPKENHP